MTDQLALHVEPNTTTTAAGQSRSQAGEGAGPDAAPAPSRVLGRRGHTDHDPELIKRCMALHIWRDYNHGLDLCPRSKDAQRNPINWRRWFWDRYQDGLEQYLQREGLA